MIRTFLLTALFSVAPLAAQAATYTYVSQPARYGDPSPAWLVGATQPSIGGPLSIDVPGTVLGSNTFYFLLSGVTQPGVDLGLIGPGFVGILYSSGEVTELTPPPSVFQQPGRALITYPIPLDFSLVGATLFQQVAQLQLPPTPSGPLSIRVGRGGIATIGL